MDSDLAQKLRRIWFLGDVHSRFDHVANAVLRASELPSWLVFLGDIECMTPLREVLAPLKRFAPTVRVAFIPGNHDYDSHELTDNLLDCGDAVNLDGRVVDLAGVNVAGLGGSFQGRIWAPPADPTFHNYDAFKQNLPHHARPSPKIRGAIYVDTYLELLTQRADVLVTHEALHLHKYGWQAITDLAAAMKVNVMLHGHTHDDLTDEYARHDLGFKAIAVDCCHIKNGLGEFIHKESEPW